MLRYLKSARLGFCVALISALVLAFGAGIGFAQSVTLQVATGDPGNPQFTHVYEEFDREFMDRYPHIQIERVASPFSVGMLNRTEWFTVRYVGGALPDVVDVNYLDAQGLAAEGILLDLTPFLEREDDFNVDDFFPVLWTPHKYNGGTYGIPGTGWPQVPTYNADLLDASGLSAPSHDWELQGEYVDYLRKLTLDTNGDGEIDQWGQDRMGASEGEIQEMLAAFGESILSEDNSQVTVTSSGAIEALEWWTGLAESRLLTPPGMWGDIRSNRGGLPWVAGATAFASFIAPQVEQYQPQFNVNATAAPIGPKGDRFSGIRGFGWGLSSATDHPNEAWLYLKEWASSEHFETLAQEMGMTGRQSSIGTVLEFYADRWPTLDISVWSEAFTYAPYAAPIGPGAPQMLRLIESFGSTILNGEEPVRSAAENFATQIQTIVDRNM